RDRPVLQGPSGRLHAHPPPREEPARRQRVAGGVRARRPSAPDRRGRGRRGGGVEGGIRVSGLAWAAVEGGDPLPFRPARGSWQHWIALAVYVALSLVLVAVVCRLARPSVESELAEPPKRAE